MAESLRMIPDTHNYKYYIQKIPKSKTIIALSLIINQCRTVIGGMNQKVVTSLCSIANTGDLKMLFANVKIFMQSSKDYEFGLKNVLT